MKKEPKIQNQQEATEIIELTISDLGTLTRAFQMIESVCSELSGEAPAESEVSVQEELVVH